MLLIFWVSVLLSNNIQNAPTSYQNPLYGVPCTPNSKSSEWNGSGIDSPNAIVRLVPAISKNRVGRQPEEALKYVSLRLPKSLPIPNPHSGTQ